MISIDQCVLTAKEYFRANIIRVDQYIFNRRLYSPTDGLVSMPLLKPLNSPGTAPNNPPEAGFYIIEDLRVLLGGGGVGTSQINLLCPTISTPGVQILLGVGSFATINVPKYFIVYRMDFALNGAVVFDFSISCAVSRCFIQ